MKINLDTNPPSFPEGVTMDDISDLLISIKTDFANVFKILPHAVGYYVFNNKLCNRPEQNIREIKELVDTQFPIVSARYYLYPLIFGSADLSPLLCDEDFSEFFAFFLNSFDSEALFETTYDFSDNSESELDGSFNVVFPTYPGCYLCSKNVLQRFRNNLTENETRFLLIMIGKCDQRLFSIEEISEFAVFFLTRMAVEKCEMHEFEVACERFYEALGEISDQSIIAQEYEELKNISDGYDNFDFYLQFIVEPKYANDKTAAAKVIENIIMKCNLELNNILRLSIYILEADFENAFLFSEKLEFGCPACELEFNEPFIEETVFDAEILEIVDDFIEKAPEDNIKRFIELTGRWREISFVLFTILLRILTNKHLKIDIPIVEYHSFYEGAHYYYSLLAYCKDYLSFCSANIDEKNLVILARFLIETYDEEQDKEKLELLVEKIQETNMFEDQVNQITETFLKDNSENIEFNENTYLRLFRRNDNLVLKLVGLIDCNAEDMGKYVELALETLEASGSIRYDVLKQLTFKLFDYSFKYFKLKTAPVEAIACLAAFYSSYDISPAFCGALNLLKDDFQRYYDNLMMDKVNYLMLPAFLLIMTGMFEVSVETCTISLAEFVRKIELSDFEAVVEPLKRNEDVYEFVFTSAIRLIMLNGPENAELSPEMHRNIMDIFIFYSRIYTADTHVTAACIECLLEAFEANYYGIMAIFNRMGRILTELLSDNENTLNKEIILLSIYGLIAFEMGPQWSSEEFVNKQFIEEELNQALNTSLIGLSDEAILKEIYCIKFVRNSFMGDKNPSNPFYREFTEYCKEIINAKDKSIEFNLLKQAAISLLMTVYNSKESNEFECKIESEVFTEIIRLMTDLEWEDVNSLEIAYSALSDMHQRRAFKGRQAGDVLAAMERMDALLPEEEEQEGDLY